MGAELPQDSNRSFLLYPFHRVRREALLLKEILRIGIQRLKKIYIYFVDIHR